MICKHSLTGYDNSQKSEYKIPRTHTQKIQSTIELIALCLLTTEI